MNSDLTSLQILVAGLYASLDEGRPLPSGVEALEGRNAHRSYRLEVDGESFVLRLRGKNAGPSAMDGSRVQAATSLAGVLGVGAEMMWADPVRDMIVTRFIPGSALTAETAGQPEILRRIAESVRHLHSGPPVPGEVFPFDSASELYELALERGVVPPPDLAEAFILLARIEAVLPPSRPDVPIHGDLRPGKLIDDGQRIRFIDWEHAAMGDRYFELGNLAANLALSDEGCRTLLESYFGEAREADLSRLFLMRMVGDLHESCRQFLSHTTPASPGHGYAEGTRRLNQFLRSAREDRFLGLLRRASRPGMRPPQA
jgi:thiamine kinase-like enzyme